jgi:hypothetical protein
MAFALLGPAGDYRSGWTGLRGKGHYLVRARSERAWLDLRNALAARRIAERNGTQLPERFRDTLLAVEAESEISAAIAEHTIRLQAVRNTWAAALPPSPAPVPGTLR